MKAVRKLLPIGVALAISAMPLLAGAQITGTEAPGAPVGTIEDILRVLELLITWVFTLLLVLAVLAILYAAFLYLASGGEPENIKEASRYLLYAFIAIVVALVARGVVVLAKQFVG